MSDEHEHLTTGWEPDLPADDTVLRGFLFAWADHLATVVAAADGRVERSDAALFTDAATDCPFDNTVMLLRPPAEVDVEETLAAADRFFPTERSWLLLSAWPIPRRDPAGWAHVGHPPFMVRPAGGSAPPVPPGLRIVVVDDDQGVADYAHVAGNDDGTPLIHGDLRPETVMVSFNGVCKVSGYGALGVAPPGTEGGGMLPSPRARSPTRAHECPPSACSWATRTTSR